MTSEVNASFQNATYFRDALDVQFLLFLLGFCLQACGMDDSKDVVPD